MVIVLMLSLAAVFVLFALEEIEKGRAAAAVGVDLLNKESIFAMSAFVDVFAEALGAGVDTDANELNEIELDIWDCDSAWEDEEPVSPPVSLPLPGPGPGYGGGRGNPIYSFG